MMMSPKLTLISISVISDAGNEFTTSWDQLDSRVSLQTDGQQMCEVLLQHHTSNEQSPYTDRLDSSSVKNPLLLIFV